MAEVSAILEGESNEWMRHVYELASHQTSMIWLFLLLFCENETGAHISVFLCLIECRIQLNIAKWMRS